MTYSETKIEDLRRRWTTKKGKELLNIIKKTHCYLRPILFREKIKNLSFITDPELKNGIDLRGIPLSNFSFKKISNGEIAILSNIHLEGAILKHCDFEDNHLYECFFENADLSHCNFKNATINSCNFENSNCSEINLQGAKLTNLNFTNAIIKNMSFSATTIDEATTFGKILKSEKEGNFHLAALEYKQIKEIFKNSNLHDIADKFHYKGMVSKRKTYKKTNPLRWTNYIFGDLLCKYGTSLIHVLIGTLIVIAICAFLYTLNDSLLFNYQSIKNPSFWDSLYFSLVTFTTLGYGDFHAIGIMRFVAGFESFIGACMMSLFTVIMARKIIRD